MNQRGITHRRLIRIACWIGIVVWATTCVLIVIGDPSTLQQMLFTIVIPIGFLATTLDQLGPLPRAAGLPLQSEARSITRGSGVLVMDMDSSIRFSSVPSQFDNLTSGDPNTLDRARQIGGKAFVRLGVLLGLILVPSAIIIGLAITTQMDPLVAMGLGYGITFIPAWLIWKHHRQVRKANPLDPSIEIPASRLLAVIPYRRLLLGPSIVVGYKTEDGTSTLWEEFFLSSLYSLLQLPTATGDPQQWEELSTVARNEAAFEAEAARYRHRIHFREGMAQWLVSSAIIAIVFTCAFGAMGLAIGSILLGLVISAIGVAAVSAFVAIIEVATFR